VPIRNYKVGSGKRRQHNPQVALGIELERGVRMPLEGENSLGEERHARIALLSNE